MKVTHAGIVVSLLFIMTGCASNKHLVFFTNSTIGLEIASDPSGGTPVKFILGYKRQEGVIDPLIPAYKFVPSTDNNLSEPEDGDTHIVMTSGGAAIPDGTYNKAHSVLAKMDFGATGGGSGASAAQFFATGLAAEILAGNPGISHALAGDSNTITSLNISKRDATRNFAHLDAIYQMLVESSDNVQAKEIQAKVDEIDKGFFRVAFKEYSYSYENNNTTLVIEDYNTTKGKASFPNVYQYLSTMNRSKDIAKKAILDNNITINNRPLTIDEKTQILEDINIYQSRYTEGEKSLSSNKDVLSMIDYVYKNILVNTTHKEGE